MNREDLLYELEDLIEKLQHTDESKEQYIDLSDEIEDLIKQLDDEGKEELLTSLKDEEDWVLEVVIIFYSSHQFTYFQNVVKTVFLPLFIFQKKVKNYL